MCCFPASCWGLHIILNVSHHCIATYIQAAVWNLTGMQLSWSIVNISAVARWVCFNKTKMLGCQSWFLFFWRLHSQPGSLGSATWAANQQPKCTDSVFIIRRFRVGHALVVYKSNRLLRRSTRLPAACFPKNPVAPATAWKQLFPRKPTGVQKGDTLLLIEQLVSRRKCCHQRVTHNVSWGPGLLRGIKRDRQREKVGALRRQARCPISRGIFSPTWLFALRN